MMKTMEAVTPRSIIFLICLYSRFITADTAIYFPVTTKTSTINENFAPGEIVTNCTATNNDANVTENLIYSLVNSQSTKHYFTKRSSQRLIRCLCGSDNCKTVNLGTPVVSLTASDADTLIPFNNVSYEIIHQTVNGTFTINKNTGLVTVNSNLTQAMYSIAVRAYDGGSPPLPAYNVFAVMFRNSYPPIFSSAKYTIIINEAVPVPSQVIIINATDGDEPGPESTVLYQIIGGGKLNGTNYFSLNSVTGVLTLINNTNLVNINKATLKVMACDNGYPQKCITGDVLVLVNTAGIYPVMPNVFTQIYDTVPVNGFVWQLTATDADMSPTSSIQYGFVNPPPAYFNLDPNSGNITLARSVFYDTAGQYDFMVTAIDKSDPDRVTTASVTVLVVRNQNSPVCLKKTNYVNITEYTPVPSSIFSSLLANDSDGDMVEYTINRVTPAQNDSDPIFYVNSKTGQIWLFKSLERTTTAIYTLTIQASDNRMNNAKTDLCNIVVNVELDQYPRYINPSADRSISEFTNLATISKVLATDGDLKGYIQYELVGLYPAQSYFSVNSTTGDISLIRSLMLDPLSQSSYTLRIEAFDSARPNRRVSQDVLITVSRNVYGPQFPQQRYNATIAETFPVAGSILLLAATDLDNETLRYNISSSTDNGLDLFFMDGPILKTKADLRTTKINFYTLTITATDPRGRSTNVLADITITRLAVDTVRISQYQPVNSVILDTNAVDPDIPNLPNRVKYELQSEPNSTYFTINRDTGEITVIKSLTLDAFNNAFYTVELYAFDEQNPNLKGKSYAVIFVEHNSNAPRFTQSNYFITVPEYTSLGSSVLGVSATDNDNDTVRYYMYLGDADGVTAAEYFTINPSDGIIRVVKSLTLAPLNTYMFRVTAFDSSVPMKTATASVTISIIRDRYAPACASRYTQSINEDVIVNNSIPVLTIVASDQDGSGQPLIYEPSGSGLARVYFNINATTGNVYVNIPLTTTTVDRFELEVAVYDPSNPSKKGYCYATLTINKDLNLPVFDTNSVTVNVWEYENIGYEVADLNAIDRDINDKVRYYLDGDNVTNAFFEVDDITGKLTLRQPLHGNSRNIYQFNIIATDGRTRNASASVTVNMVRDKIPYIVNPVTSVSLSESEVVGKNVLNVTAQDDDKRGKIQCISTGRGLAESFLQINIDTGAITLIKNLSSDISSYYDFEVVCYDSALPSVRSSPVVIRFNILRNQYPPVFQSLPYNFQIDVDRNGNNLGYLVGRMSASDRDGDIPYYTLSSTDNSANYFFLDRNSGNIYLINSLVNLPSSQTQFRFNVIATDSVFNVTIDEHLPVGNTILKLTATDQNLQGYITYLVTGIDPADSFFTVGTDGYITVRRDLRLDVFPRRDYTFTVVAFDSTFLSNRATATVYITVIRNANSPYFPQPTITVSVPETKATQDLVTKVAATDADNDTVSYVLVRDKSGGDGLSFFYIEPNTGNIYLRRPLTESTNNSYTLVVSATDSGNPSKSSSVDVVVNVLRIAKPVFSVSQSSITLPDNTTIGTSVFKFDATKLGGAITYEVVGDGIAPYLFAVSSDGTVTMKNSLKGFKDLSYTLIVNALDPAYPQFKTSAQLTTIITNEQHWSGESRCKSDCYEIEAEDKSTLPQALLRLHINAPTVFAHLPDYSRLIPQFVFLTDCESD
ncbi:hypothetical protein Btru_025318 [Bulinus truncatus]|nr:hypothetical protein Btru_025318 [Bulinus truncatus]